MSSYLYVYYKTSADAVVAPRVGAMQAQIARLTGVRGRLLRRRDDPGTWMEIYDDIGSFESFEPLLAAAIAEHGLEDLVRPGERRHAERFVAP